ncbi:protein mono-ADP-ribosyltransferase PARP3-like [Lineus longissimus]|uniref:protein mono-ADP-ribosyltransferase PARP3-like n=1 Tax=Lineus longissimus TaxID=88925 RepID=UPI002B4D4D99
MPPKKKGAAATKRKAPAKAPAGGKKAKKEPEEPTVTDIVSTLKAAGSSKKKVHKVDEHCHLKSNHEVYEDYDCMLNQTNIGKNNNKYYVIQLLVGGRNYYAWNRWGRVGESGANAIKGPFTDVNKAIKEFEKKFKDKTKNDWKNRDSFEPVAGKYSLIEMADDDGNDAAPSAPAAKSGGIGKTKPCSLDATTQKLLNLILDTDMFKDAMKKFDIDVKKMPLGKLSKPQLAKGFECLEEMEEIIKKGKGKAKLTELSSKFYTVVPHDFGRQRPPIIDDVETLQKKYDMLAVLGDIEIAQSMQKQKQKTLSACKSDIPHPLDVNYELLKCDLDVLDKKSKEFKVVDTYCKNTQGYRKVVIDSVWKVNRHDEAKRIAVHDKLGNRKLLWHGTNVAVVAAILKTGLRIMPHSGGRVGRGIYFASENGKSSGYVGTAPSNEGIMFLNEVILGNEHHITRDDHTLKVAPSGSDSVIAMGWNEPDPKQDTSLKLDGKAVVVPQGKPVKRDAYYQKSSFDQSEYLIYKESQQRIRYMILGKFSY